MSKIFPDWFEINSNGEFLVDGQKFEFPSRNVKATPENQSDEYKTFAAIESHVIEKLKAAIKAETKEGSSISVLRNICHSVIWSAVYAASGYDPKDCKSFKAKGSLDCFLSYIRRLQEANRERTISDDQYETLGNITAKFIYWATGLKSDVLRMLTFLEPKLKQEDCKLLISINQKSKKVVATGFEDILQSKITGKVSTIPDGFEQEYKFSDFDGLTLEEAFELFNTPHALYLERLKGTESEE